MMKYLFVAIAVIFVSSFGLGQSIQLNEIVSSNGDNLYDEDGDTPDWIETVSYTHLTLPTTPYV